MLWDKKCPKELCNIHMEELTMENETYKKLYLHAFNRLTDLQKEIEQLQSELEEMYLDLSEPHPNS